MVMVRPTAERPPRRPGVGPALGVAGLLIAALGMMNVLDAGSPGGGIEPEPDAGVEPRRPPPPASGPLDPGPASRSIPVAILGEGMFTAIDAGPIGVEPVWRMWDAASTHPRTVPLPFGAERLALDPSGRAVAFMLPAGRFGRSLWVRYADGTGLRVAEDVLTFAWKTADPDRIAWSSPAPGGIRLSTARLAGPDSAVVLDERVVADVEPGVVVGWTSLGVWVERFDEVGGERTFSAYAVSGRRSAIRRADIVAFHPDGDGYLVASSVGDDWLVLAVDRGDVSERIPWSPQGTELTAAAWANGDSGRIAFGGFDRGSLVWGVMVWDPALGQVTHRIDLPYRVLGLGWSPNDRLLLVSVTDDRGRTAVLAYDVHSMVDHRVVFDELVVATVVPVPGAVVAVPEVTGLPTSEAMRVLAEAGLVGDTEEGSVTPGLAVHQTPPPGAAADAGSVVTIRVGDPASFAELDAIVPEAVGNAECAPASPYGPTISVGGTEASLTEIRGTGDFELWGQLLTAPPLRTDRLIKMVVRFDAEGDPIFLARHPVRLVTYSRWGPFLHPDDASGYGRPGQEWSIGFTLREPGCWTIRVVVGWEWSDFYVRVW